MLPQPRRLKKENDIKRVFREGRTFRGSPLSLRMAANRLECSRFGFVVPAKIVKKAASRNKIKRRMSEIIRLRLPEIKEGYDALILASSGIEGASFPELGKTLDNLFQKANLIHHG